MTLRTLRPNPNACLFLGAWIAAFAILAAAYLAIAAVVAQIGGAL